MPWRTAWAIPWLLVALLAALLIQGSTAQDGNLLINGGFEEVDSNGRPLYWLAIGGELKVDDRFVLEGSQAGVFDAASISEAGVSQCLPVAPSSVYQFRGYAARHEGEMLTVELRVSWHDESDCSVAGQGGGRQSAELGETGQWYELAVGARSPANARAARLRIVVEESGATVYLDDFSVSGPAAPTETATPTPEPSSSPSASPTLTPTATARPRTPVPSATAPISPTASSWQRTPVPAPGRLLNGGFEEADSEGLPLSWKKYGGTLARTSSVRIEGQFAAAFTSHTSSTKWAYQVVAVQGGKAYTLSAYALKDDPAVAAAYLRLSWYASPDGSGQAIDSVDSIERLTDDSPQFRFLTTGAVVAPAEAISAKVRLMLDPVGEAPGTVYFDAVTFEETAPPEPTLSPTATLIVVDDEQTPPPPSPTVTHSAVAATSERPTAPAPVGATISPPPSPAPTAAGAEGGRTPAALGATRVPVATATLTPPLATREPAAVYRQRKSGPSLGDDTAASREENAQGGLSPSLLALGAAVPALVGTTVGVYYWRWRRARLR